MGGVRLRLAAALVAVAASTVVAIGLGTYAFVDAQLRAGLLADATRQAQFNLSVLVPDALPANATSATFQASDLGEAFRRRGNVETIADFGNGDVYYSSSTLNGALAALPADLRAIVARGDLGYAWLTLAGRPDLVVGGRQGAHPDLYFVFSAGPVEEALAELRLGLAAAGLLAALLALVTSGLVARRILRPVESASAAARRIAAGDLSARVPAGGRDEFGAWALEFNRMADSLEGTIERLEVAEGQNRRFVAEVSHELRTPLTALVAEVALIEGALERLPADDRRAAELLVADVRRLRTLVEDLMELSRFDAGAERPQLGPLDLGRAVSSIVATRLPGAAVDLPSQPVIVESDMRRLDRILGNLLDNARVHAPGAPVEVAVRATDGAATVSVADRGPGVPPEVVPRLFERFFKLDPSRRSGSSGLGLAIAAEHAALLGGELRGEPRPGGGLVFTLRLPVTGSLPDRDVAVTGEDQPGGASDAGVAST